MDLLDFEKNIVTLKRDISSLNDMIDTCNATGLGMSAAALSACMAGKQAELAQMQQIQSRSHDVLYPNNNTTATDPRNTKFSDYFDHSKLITKRDDRIVANPIQFKRSTRPDATITKPESVTLDFKSWTGKSSSVPVNPNRKSYHDICIEALQYLGRGTVNDIYSYAVSNSLLGACSRATALRKIRDRVRSVAVTSHASGTWELPIPARDLNSIQSQDCNAVPFGEYDSAINGSFIRKEDKIPFPVSTINVSKVYVTDTMSSIICNVIDDLLEHNDISAEMSVKLPDQLKAFIAGSKIRAEITDHEFFNHGLNGTIPSDWIQFHEIGKEVLREFNKLSAEVKKYCKLAT